MTIRAELTLVIFKDLSGYKYRFFSRLARSWQIMQKVCFLLEHGLVSTTNGPLVTGVSAGAVGRATACSLKCILEGCPPKRLAKLGNMGRKYTRMQLGKIETNKSVLHLGFIKRELPFSFNTIFFWLYFDTWCFGPFEPFRVLVCSTTIKIVILIYSDGKNNLSANTNYYGKMSCHLEDVFPTTVADGIKDPQH